MSSAGAPPAAVALPRAAFPPLGCNCTTLHTLPLSRGSSSISRQDIRPTYVENYTKKTQQFLRERPMSRFACQVSFQRPTRALSVDIPPTSRQAIEPFRACAALSVWLGPRDEHVTECGLAYHRRGSTFRSRFGGLDDARRRLRVGRARHFAGLMMSQCDPSHIGAHATQLSLVGS